MTGKRPFYILTMILVLLVGVAGGTAERQLFNQLEEKKLTAGDAQPLDVFGWSVAIGVDTVIVCAPWEDGGPGNPISVAGAAYVFSRDQGGVNNWSQVTKLLADDAQSTDWFCDSVAIDGDTVVIGAIWEDGGLGDPLPGAGAAYIFERNQGGSNNWGQVAKLTASDAQTIDDFGNSVAISSNTIIVGAHLEDGGPGDPIPTAGAAYIFERNQGGGNNWGQVTKLTAADAQANDYFGRSVAISGDIIVVGAGSESGGPGDPLPGAGAAYIFERNQGGTNNWGQVTKLTASDAQISDQFGESVAISEDTILIGAINAAGGPDNSLPYAGAAYIFERNQSEANNWGEVTKLSADDAQNFDDFGISVSIGGNTLIVGAFRADGGPGDPIPDAGAAYIFERDQGGTENWGQVTKLSASDAQANDRFGFSVSTNGGAFIAGSPLDDGESGNPFTDIGAAYVYWNINFTYLPIIFGQ